MNFEGKKGLIIGVANDHSIAWAIAQEILAGEASVGSPISLTEPTTINKKIAAESRN